MSDNKAYESGYDHGESSRDNDWMFALQEVAELGDDIPTSPHAFAIWLNEHWPFESRGGPDEPIQGSEEKTMDHPLEGPRVWWCEEHWCSTLHSPADHCQLGVVDDSTESCRMVERILVEP